jgi:hypothetical protein
MAPALVDERYVRVSKPEAARGWQRRFYRAAADADVPHVDGRDELVMIDSNYNVATNGSKGRRGSERDRQPRHFNSAGRTEAVGAMDIADRVYVAGHGRVVLKARQMSCGRGMTCARMAGLIFLIGIPKFNRRFWRPHPSEARARFGDGSSNRLTNSDWIIGDWMQTYVDRQRFCGLFGPCCQAGEVYFSATGKRDLETGQPFTRDRTHLFYDKTDVRIGHHHDAGRTKGTVPS